MLFYSRICDSDFFIGDLCLIGTIQRASFIRERSSGCWFICTMADSRIYLAFCGYTLILYYVADDRGVLLTFLAVINGYKLAKASNKNFDKWFQFIISAACAVLASVSLYGTALSTAYDMAFLAGPWYFFSSIVLASFHQLVMLGLNGSKHL